MFLISLFNPEVFFFHWELNIFHMEKKKGFKIQTLSLHSHAEFHSHGFGWFTSENSLLQDLELNQWPKFALFGS